MSRSKDKQLEHFTGENLPEPDKEHDADWEREEPSKSELKRRMSDLRKLADELSRIPHADLSGFNLVPSLVESIETARRLKSSNARNRQLRHASKLLDKSGEDVIGQVHGYFEAKRLKAQSFNAHHKLIESWRDRIASDPNEAVQALIHDYPSTDRQEIRTLARQAAKEKTEGLASTQQRKLFCYLRDQIIV